MSRFEVFPDSYRGRAPAIIPAQYYAFNEFEHLSANAQDGLPPETTTIGALESEIPCSRHHIISWKILRESWNKSVTKIVPGGKDSAQAKNICEWMLRVLLERGSHNLDQPTDEDLCWGKRNLIIGPSTENRMFDAGDDIDFEGTFGLAEGNEKRYLHIMAMVELGKALKAWINRQDLEPVKVVVRIRALSRHITLEGDDFCQFKRIEWKLHQKPQATWRKVKDKWECTVDKKISKWHRGSYTTAEAVKYWVPDANVSVSELHKKTIELRVAHHQRFIEGLANQPHRRKFDFLDLEPL